MHLGLVHYLTVSAVLFGLGLLTVMTRRNTVGILLGVELLLNAAALNFIAFEHFVAGGAAGQVFTIFIITLAASEVAIALAAGLPDSDVFTLVQRQITARARRAVALREAA